MKTSLRKNQKIYAIIVAGGRGERLRPLTDKIPKPMVEVNNKPILEHTINLFKDNGITDFIIALCYLPKVITSYFGDGSKFGVNITYTYEDPNFPLGTAGAVLPAKKYIDSTFIVTYADILRELNIAKMVKQHQKKRSFATLNTYQHQGLNYKSQLKFDSDKKLIEFIELPISTTLEKGFVWSNGSFYIFEPEVFEFILPNQKTDFARDIFPKFLSSGKKIHVFQSKGYFTDIGNLEKLKEARIKYSQKD